MDIILSAYATENLAKMDNAKITLYDHLLDENDQDLYQWVTGQVVAPDKFIQMIAEISVQMQSGISGTGGNSLSAGAWGAHRCHRGGLPTIVV